jgi:hypothetical protein
LTGEDDSFLKSSHHLSWIHFRSYFEFIFLGQL